MIKNTILVSASAYAGTMLPEITVGVLMLIATAVCVFALAFDRMNKAYGS